ncbi:MAG TPA: hypothetical protein VGC89_16850, partial [Pyrinomonadaceae bacterium]
MKKHIYITNLEKRPAAALRLLETPADWAQLERPDLLSAAAVYLASLKPSTCRVQRAILYRVARLMGANFGEIHWQNFRFGHLELLRSKMQRLELSPSTIN